ncbi:unnamed protein product, partial [Staurois parvus]
MQVPGTDDQCPDDLCPAVPPRKFRLPVPCSAPTSSTHLCPADHPPVPTCAAVHPPVP